MQLKLQNVSVSGRLVSVSVQKVTRKADQKVFSIEKLYLLMPNGEVSEIGLSEAVPADSIKSFINQEVFVFLDIKIGSPFLLEPF